MSRVHVNPRYLEAVGIQQLSDEPSAEEVVAAVCCAAECGKYWKGRLRAASHALNIAVSHGLSHTRPTDPFETTFVPREGRAVFNATVLDCNEFEHDWNTTAVPLPERRRRVKPRTKFIESEPVLWQRVSRPQQVRCSLITDPVPGHDVSDFVGVGGQVVGDELVRVVLEAQRYCDEAAAAERAAREVFSEMFWEWCDPDEDLEVSCGTRRLVVTGGVNREFAVSPRTVDWQLFREEAPELFGRWTVVGREKRWQAVVYSKSQVVGGEVKVQEYEPVRGGVLHWQRPAFTDDEVQPFEGE